MPDETVVPFDKPRKRRYTRESVGKKTETDLVSFRAPIEEIRRVDEIVASGTDAQLGTRSDVMNDALHRWLTEYLEEHATDVPRTRDLFILDHHQWLLNHRQQEITKMSEMLDQSIRDGHISMLTIILYNAYRLKSELDGDQYGSPVQVKKCEEIIDRTRKAMGHAS